MGVHSSGQYLLLDVLVDGENVAAVLVDKSRYAGYKSLLIGTVQSQYS